MGEKAKVILNEYSARDLLHKGTINPEKFYTSDLKLIIEVAQKEIKELKKYKLMWNALAQKIIDLYNPSQEILYLDILTIMQELEKKRWEIMNGK